MIPADVPSVNALAAQLRSAAAQVANAVATASDEHEQACPRHLRGEAARALGSAEALAPIIDGTADALVVYAQAMAELAVERRAVQAEIDRQGLAVTPDRVLPGPGPRAVGDPRAEAAFAEAVARLNRRRLVATERAAAAEERLASALARHIERAGAVANQLR
ncbi:MAG: hypothetical protein V9G19_14610 [Tetrasphaera sp.]